MLPLSRRRLKLVQLPTKPLRPLVLRFTPTRMECLARNAQRDCSSRRRSLPNNRRRPPRGRSTELTRQLSMPRRKS